MSIGVLGGPVFEPARVEVITRVERLCIEIESNS